MAIRNRKCSKLLDKERELLEHAEEKGVSSCLTGTGFSRYKRVRLIHYFEIIDELVDMGVRREDAQNNIPLSVCESSWNKTKDLVNFHSLKKTSSIRKKMMDYFFLCAVNNKPAELPDLIKASGELRTKWTNEDYKMHYSLQAANFANSLVKRHNTMRIKRLSEKDDIGKIIVSPWNVRHYLMLACTAPQYSLLTQVSNAGYGDDEYAAFCFAIKLLGEYLQREGK